MQTRTATQPYVALNNLHAVAGDGGGYSEERELGPNPEPIIPLCLLRLQTSPGFS